MDEQLVKILKYLPAKVSDAIKSFLLSLQERTAYISEIRLRANAPISVSYGKRNIMCFAGKYIVCSEKEVAEALQKLCEDSVHTYGESIKEGYVVLENGYRVGVCGRAGVEGNTIRSVYGITSLSIRIPHPICGVANGILPLLREKDAIYSALIYSVPNVGKTTLIRDVAVSFSKGPYAKRIALIDTRGEIYMKKMFSECIADVLYGYPRAKGIEIATRTLSPEIIFCDEIGSFEEAQSILSAQNSGVPLIATAHADTLENLLKRPNVRLLYDSGIFRYYIGLSREEGTSQFCYEIFDTYQCQEVAV